MPCSGCAAVPLVLGGGTLVLVFVPNQQSTLEYRFDEHRAVTVRKATTVPSLLDEYSHGHCTCERIMQQ